MGEVSLLIKPRLLSLHNELLYPGRKRLVSVVVLGICFCGGLFALSSWALLYFRNFELIGDLLARQLLSMIFLTLFALLTFSHVVSSLSSLYFSHDLEFCHSAPVSLEELFLARAILAFMSSSWMLAVFGLPVFLAYAYVYKAGAWFYLTLIHMSLAMAVITAALGCLTSMVLVYAFPAHRTRDLVMLLSLLVLVALYLTFRFLRPERLVNPESFLSFAQYLSSLRAPQSPYLPTQWIADSLWQSLYGALSRRHWFQVLLTWSSAGAVAVITVWTAHFIYFPGFSKSRAAKKRRSGGRLILDLLVRLITKPFGDDLGALLAKDIRCFFRDYTQWSQLLLLFALVVVYVYNFSVLPLDEIPLRLDYLQNQVALLNMGLAGLVLSAVAARFVFPAVSMEGGAYWVIRSSPMKLKRYLWGKYVTLVFPMLLVAEILVNLTNYYLQASGWMIVLSTVSVPLMVLGIVGLGVGLGARSPNFKYQDINQVATGVGGMVYMIVSSFFVAGLVALEAGPAYIIYMALSHSGRIGMIEWFYTAACFAAVPVLALMAIFIPVKRGLQALEEYED